MPVIRDDVVSRLAALRRVVVAATDRLEAAFSRDSASLTLIADSVSALFAARAIVLKDVVRAAIAMVEFVTSVASLSTVENAVTSLESDEVAARLTSLSSEGTAAEERDEVAFSEALT